jgi:hypothetical protein
MIPQAVEIKTYASHSSKVGGFMNFKHEDAIEGFQTQFNLAT